LLDRLELPAGVAITLQGGEPFLHPGIWNLLNLTRQKIDILTALPGNVTRADFGRLKSLEWNRRDAPYPTIRVSYHKWQQNYLSLVRRVAELKDILSIGLFVLGEPIHWRAELDQIWRVADEWHVECRVKEFLGDWQGVKYGDYQYPEAVSGEVAREKVWCRNTVAVIGPDAAVYRCHSDLYHGRQPLGNLRDDGFRFPAGHEGCNAFGLCNPCDVKNKTNSRQEYPYTSVEILFESPDNKNGV